MEREERQARLALNAVPGLGPSSIRRLLEWAGSASAALTQCQHWPEAVRRQTSSLEEEALRRLGREQEAWCLENKVEALIQGQKAYPDRLEHLEHPPPVLFVLGQVEALQGSPLPFTVIGARACTSYGRSQAHRFGAGLASRGAVVYSGGARGIDQAALRGAVDHGGVAVAVLGSSLDRLYPAEIPALIEPILEQGGAVVSEFPFGSQIRRGNFPRRNRLLAAFARGVLVVEATEKSGSMITVGWALDLGRDVFALPGPVDSRASHGPIRLLREGAMAVNDPGQIWQHYNLGEASDPDSSGAQTPLLALLHQGDHSLDSLAQALGQPPERVLLDLVELELKGRVIRLPGGAYHRCGPGGS
ncbi:MAG: DNA-protecting protein DprA [Planctomycetota bacterium]|nr:MAG: DNA-protecting protein DprA [Planctomycetota bacterium]